MLLIVTAAGGCGDGEAGGPESLTVYVSAPLSGERAAEGRAIVAGARLALADADARVGELRIRAVYRDDTGGGPRWDPVATAANARRAAEDSSAIAYIGEVDSGATRVSLPITNQAEIAQVSPGATAVDLTRTTGGVDPDRYRPSGEQTFARLVVDDQGLAEAAAAISRRRGLVALPSNLLGQARRRCARAAAPVLVVFPYGRPRGRFRADPVRAYGYEAMALVLDAIRRAGEDGDNRGAVVEELLATHDRRSAIGTYSIEEEGDTTSDRTSVYRMRDCRGDPLA